ncbi:LL-diaminopimelate aminotransferase [Pseudobacteroides cellulosolvens]|uniref:Aminotransferase n=1 Tax=Pseudobacteroides cellulosolvens ATCC 35603 = DSM 2933 TaxID=398512 RepID=A0A0L6JNU3_9FIRM|nr:LL-diaminopimelate aminotransferase [Pseudobacteroides cellulosolvens]KNY27448.1 LL-diaminopimelate aminotransferase [Pseudobacteroides cellulosolvens ATCC 35603 = DSM 2933]
MSFLINNFAKRVGGSNFGKDKGTYKFALIKKAKERALSSNKGVEFIDMGVGEPDTPAVPEIVEVLAMEAGKPENRFYSDNGIPEFYHAASDYLKNVFGIDINPRSEIIHGIGSKPVLAMLPAVFINPGDVCITTTPGYPVISTWTKYFGGEVFSLKLTNENNFYPEFHDIPESILKKAKILYINYPNNPTGQVATKEFYNQVVEFAFKNRIAVVSDAAYGALVYRGYRPLSFLSVDGAKDIGVEVFSLSKAFNMTGWRAAFVAGNKDIVSAYGMVKDNTDSGQFRAILKAGIYAMNHPEITQKTCQKYERRFGMLMEALKDAGFDPRMPKGTFYCYVKAPKGAGNTVFNNAQEAAEYIIEKAMISVVPWDDAGAYLRFSVTFEASSIEEEKSIVDEVRRRLLDLRLYF